MKKNTSAALGTSLVIIVMTVCFGFNSSVLDSANQHELDDLVLQLDSLSDYTVHLDGHTDNVGSNSYNNHLSNKRALEVRSYLISNNVDSTKIVIDYFGEDQPFVPNTSEENRALNRRVEITVSGSLHNTEEQKTEFVSMNEPQPDSTSKIKTNVVSKPVVKKKKAHRRLVWTGWRTGFHWSTSGR